MSAALKIEPISVEDYLAGELISQVKHEYVGGWVYAMAGAKNIHNQIASNVLGALYGKLRGNRCRPFNSDTKVRVRFPHQTRFYYPDVSVVCRLNPPHDSFQDDPAVIVEVLSQKTRRIDEGEKKDAYFALQSLSVYLLVEQDFPAVVAYRRTDAGFVREVYADAEAVISLPEIGAELPLIEVYDGVEFTLEIDDDAEL